MDDKKLAKLFYEQAKTFAQVHNVSMSAVAAAQFHASIRMSLELNGADNVNAWIDRRSAEFRNTLNEHPTWFDKRIVAK